MPRRRLWQRIRTALYTGYVKFFRIRLLTLPPDEIASLVDSYEKDVKTIKTESLKMTWFMRGGVTMEEIYMSAPEDREIMAKVIKDNLDTAKKTGQPFF